MNIKKIKEDRTEAEAYQIALGYLKELGNAAGEININVRTIAAQIEGENATFKVILKIEKVIDDPVQLSIREQPKSKRRLPRLRQ